MKLYILGDEPQQCPADFPKAFGYGKFCCHHNKDKDDIFITSHSQTCKSNVYRPCPKDHCVDNGKNYYTTALG